MRGLYLLGSTVAVLWLLSIGAALFAMRWSKQKGLLPFWGSLILSACALVLSYLGLTRFHFAYSKTVDDSHWGVDSKWFFVIAIVLGTISLALTLVRHSRYRFARK